MVTLAIETSCDETSLALIESTEAGIRVHAHLTHSQIATHAQYGGVFPHVAKREHAQLIWPLLQSLFTESKLPLSPTSITEDHFTVLTEWEKFEPEVLEAFKQNTTFSAPKIDRIAVTFGPGLEPTLWVGINFARSLAHILNVPLIGVNHMEGHIMSALFNTQSYTAPTPLQDISFPSIAFLVSGGHTEIVLMKSFGLYEVLGTTKDDAVGEAYDKVARMMELPYPGGPKLAALAEEGRAQNVSVKFPRPMIDRPDLSMSFSGLKTAVLYHLRDNPNTAKEAIAAGFEEAVTEVLVTKLKRALNEHVAQALIIAGGVIANTHLRTAFKAVADEYGIPLHIPNMEITGDNALMIGLASLHQQPIDPKTVRANGTLSL